MVIVLKLMNGETIMGLLGLEDEDLFLIQDPFILEYRVDAKGYRSMVLHRYNPFSEESTIQFNKNMIVTNYTADVDLVEYYYYSLDHSIKFRDKAMSTDIQRASEYLQNLIDNNNNIYKDVVEKDTDTETIPVSHTYSGNTVH